MKTIAILGCGWLGFPLAQQLIKQGYRIKGSTTTPAKLPILEAAGIIPFQITLGADGNEGATTAFLEGVETLLIDIPPKLRGAVKENFVSKIAHLIPEIKGASIPNVIFISSTSVYADDDTTVTATTLAQPETDSGIQLLEAEKLLQNDPGFNTTVVRFAGLIGEDRHPVKFLSGKTGIKDPDAPINLIHQDDCIGILQQIIAKEAWNTTFTAAAPQHPSRKEYYTQKAKELQLSLPEFENDVPSKGKTIDSQKVISELGYMFQQRL